MSATKNVICTAETRKNNTPPTTSHHKTDPQKKKTKAKIQ
jgi:hypothetical protein